MKLSPVGILVVLVGALAAIIIWVVGYFELPNESTHRNLAQNPAVQTSVGNTASAASGGQAAGGGAAATQPAYALDKAPKTIDLSIQTENSDNMMNFNGYGKGALKVSVPVGWTVKVTYSNQQNIPHSVGFVPWAQRETPNGQFTPAFTGSVGPTAKFASGVPAGQPYSYTFTADKAGQYALVCGVPGHAAGGMWDEFDVDAKATGPTVTTDKGTVTVK